MMSYSKRSRYSRSPSPYKRDSRSVSGSRSWSRSRSPPSDVENPGNNLYVTGLSPRITKRELEKHFASEGKVIDVHLVVDPWTRESRGFGFVTMATVGEADRCIKCLDRSVLEGRVITVEKTVRARRRRGRTPTPGRYLGLRTIRVRRQSPSHSPSRRSPSYSSYRRGRSQSPRYSSERSRSRSYTPYYSRRRSYSPYYSRRRSYSRSRTPYSRSPDDRYYRRRDRSYSPDDRYHRRHDRSYPPYDSRYDDRYYRRHDRSYSPYDYRNYSPDRRDRYRYRSVSRSPTPPRKRRSSRRSYSRSVSPKHRRSLRRSYSPSLSPRSRRSYSRSVSPRPRKSVSLFKRVDSPESFSRGSSRSPGTASSRSFSTSVSPRSGSP